MKNNMPCYLIEDLLPLYIEDQVSEATKTLIQQHLAACKQCRTMYENMSANPFSGISTSEEVPEVDISTQKTYLLKARRVVLLLGMSIVILFIVLTGSSYFIGRTQGVYSERFKQAEKYHLFYEVNAVREFEGSKLKLARILLDGSLTSITLESDLNLNYFGSIVLRDDLNNFYRRAFVPFEKHITNSSPGIYILDFESVKPEAQSLFLELTRFSEDESSASVIFEIPLTGKPGSQSPPLYLGILQAVLSEIKMELDLEQGISHTGLILNLDYTDTPYDGVSFGWDTRKGLKDLSILTLKPKASAKPLEVLSIEDITMENLIPAADKTTIHRQTNRTYRFITTPLPENSTGLELALDNLYAYKYIYTLDQPLDAAQNNTALDRTYSAAGYNILLASAQKENEVLKLYYEIRDNDNNLLPDLLLDARLRPADGQYDVPLQGLPKRDGAGNYLEFPAMDTGHYTLDLLRVGLKLESGTYLLDLE